MSTKEFTQIKNEQKLFYFKPVLLFAIPSQISRAMLDKIVFSNLFFKHPIASLQCGHEIFYQAKEFLRPLFVRHMACIPHDLQLRIWEQGC